MSAEDALKLISDSKAKFVDFRFTDTHGKEQHLSVPASVIDGELFEDGKMFDGSSIAGWKGINESDMILMPDPDTAVIDPFMQDTTVLLRCDVIEPATMQGYDRDPRSIAKRAEAYLKSTGAGDTAYFGPEAEFFVFDSVRWSNDMSGAAYQIESTEAAWSSEKDYEDGNIGHRPGVKGGYFPVPPVDSLQDVRSSMCLAMEDMGLGVEVHHHEVGTAGQGEIGVLFDTLVSKADQTQIYKYCIHNVAHAHGLTATFMPKPLVGDNGSGMHVHQSIFKGGDNTFAGDEYGGLSETALFYIGGIFKHARALNAFTNASTNSYKRLVPGFEAPVMLAYSAATARHHAAYLMSATLKRGVLKFGSRILPLTLISHFQPCCWQVLTGSRTVSIPGVLWIRIFTICRLRKKRKSRQLLTHSIRPSKHWIWTVSFSRWAVS